MLCLTLRLLAGLFLALLAQLAQAQSLESVLRPGDLVRSHAKWEEECTACHVRFDKNGQSGRCMDCHKPIGRDVRERTGLHGKMPAQACKACHTDHKGRDARIAEFDKSKFDHSGTDFALKGKHAKVECAKCHAPSKKYSEAAHDCKACHVKDDVHKGSLGATCGDCHTEADWKQTRFDHSSTRFALTGKHVDTQCADCHRSAVYKEVPKTCVGCHRKDDDGARGHKGRFGDKCETCHGSKAFKPSSFNHDTDTKYALRGKHRGPACGACHTGNLYKDKLGSACVDCHIKDDKHKNSLGRECQACHVERDWKETGRFDHDRSQFPLVGKHRDVICASCHEGGKYKGTALTCVGCHVKDDKHKTTLGEQCQSCHNEQRWTDVARFDHAKSRFALLGKHINTACVACHKKPDHLLSYRKTPSDCVACHKDDDKHAGNVGIACADCHSEQTWKSAPRFDHQRTRFALRNGHAAKAVTCASCHADVKSYRHTDTTCAACHTKDDKHAGQLGKACETCHDDTRWTSTRFDHASARFPLVGRHLVVQCKNCHASARYKDAPRDCDGCHRKDDKHALKLGTACETCHNARSWRTWAFDHTRRTRYALDGAHKKVACEACHSAPAPKGKNIADVGSTCVSCHHKDDKHDGAFGPQCERCHTATDWRQISNRTGARGGAWLTAGLGLGAASWFARGGAVLTAAAQGSARRRLS